MDWKRLTASALMLGLLALPASAASITPQTTMKEIRDDPDIRASGLYTYTYVWERDCEKLSTSRDDETLAEVVDDTSAEACAAGLNYLAQVYHDGVQVTYPLYSEEDIAAMPSRAHAELYYCPAEQPGAKFAIVLSGNSLYYSGELRGGVSTAWELHQQGYAVFSLRYRIGLEAGDDAPMEDLARAIRLVLANADTFGVSTEDYALLGYSSGGQIAGVFGNEEKGWGRYGVPKPGALLLALLLLHGLEAGDAGLPAHLPVVWPERQDAHGLRLPAAGAGPCQGPAGQRRAQPGAGLRRRQAWRRHRRGHRRGGLGSRRRRILEERFGRIKKRGKGYVRFE